MGSQQHDGLLHIMISLNDTVSIPDISHLLLSSSAAFQGTAETAAELPPPDTRILRNCKKLQEGPHS